MESERAPPVETLSRGVCCTRDVPEEKGKGREREGRREKILYLATLAGRRHQQLSHSFKTEAIIAI